MSEPDGALWDALGDVKKQRFLAAYAETGQVTSAAIAAHMSKSSHYDWVKSDAAYAEAFAEATRMAGDTLQDEAVRRARDGIRRDVWYKGEVVGSEVAYSDLLLIFLLKGAKPDVYVERLQHSGDPERPLEVHHRYGSKP